MFEAVRQLSGKQKTDSVSVFNTKNQLVDNDSDKAEIIRNYFEEHYTGPESEPPIEPFIGIPRPLHNPISAVEVELAAKKLRNGKAVGPDGIPNEFLKHWGGGGLTRILPLIAPNRPVRQRQNAA